MIPAAPHSVREERRSHYASNMSQALQDIHPLCNLSAEGRSQTRGKPVIRPLIRAALDSLNNSIFCAYGMLGTLPVI